MNALRQEILPPSGVEHAVSLMLTPSARRAPLAASSSSPQLGVATNLVVARQNLLRVFEVRIEAAPLPSQEKLLADEQGRGRRGMEAVEGEVEMDVGGEGFVSAGIVKSAGQHARQRQRTVTRLYLVRQHRLHGIVTGLGRVQTMASLEDKLDRLLVSFKDAKIALLEWSEVSHDLSTISIHTYERAPQMLAFDSARALTELRIDPNSRCAALTLPGDAVAILPFYESQAELDMDVDQGGVSRDVPYSPSFILSLPEVDNDIRNIIDIAFLPGFNNPTLAVLFETQRTWTGRLAEFKDTVRLRILTLDVVTRTYPIIGSVDGLPYDSMRLVACPAALGGVIVLTANAVLHIDQSGKNVAVAANGWAARVSEFPTPAPERDETLEGSRAVFVSDKTFLLVYRDGSIVPVELILEGRMVTKIDMGQRLAQTTIPTVVCAVQDDLVLVGSTAGPSILLKVTHEEEDITPDAGSARENGAANGNSTNGATYDDPMDSEDEDLYGGTDMMVTSTSGTLTVGGTAALEKRRILRLALADSLCGHGPISDMAFILGRNGERHVPELLAGVGVGHTGGLARFQRDLPARVKRKLHRISGNRGVWSFPVRRAVKVAGMNIERPTGAADWDTVIVSTDATPSPGLSRVAVKDSSTDVDILTRLPAITIGAGPFFQRTAILQVVNNAIRVLEADGSERQVIKDLDGTTPRAKIRACSISDPFVVVVREDDTLGLFVGETGKGKLRRKDMSMLGDKASRYLAASFYQDHSGLFQVGTARSLKGKEKANAPASTTIEAAMDEGRGSQWLVLCRPQGVVEIWALPKLTLVFSCGGVSDIPPVMADTFDLATPSPVQDPPRQAEDHDVEEILISPIGETTPRPHLLVLLRSGTVAVYDTAPVELPPVATGREAGLQLAFVRIMSRAVDTAPIERAEKRGAPAPRHLIPFSTSVSGVFLTGGKPGWILGTDKTAVRLVPAVNQVVHSFTACSLWGNRGEFLMNTDEGPCLVEWMPDLRLDEELPSFFMPRGRPYTSIAYEATTGMVIAASSLRSRFVLFDEDGNTVWKPDAEFISDPTTDTSSLELIDPETWTTVDGFEFAFNEMINTVRTVNLETVSTEAGSKDFIAVGTTVFRGEDLAVKGATYIFEVIEVVPDDTQQRRHKLKLWCRDEAKGPVSALCGINGYLVSSMGQKVFVRAFDLNERLVGVAFMDVGIYVTSLRTLKNLLLIGDAVKSVWFVAFQEDPFKLQLLGKDFQRAALTSAEFFFGFGEMTIVSTDEQNVLRIFRYDPMHAEAQDGQKLLCQTEFNTQSDARGTTTILRRTSDEDILLPQSKIMYCGTDGSLSALLPVEEHVFKRLHLLQGQMTRNIQHVAGLHPKAFRVVRNDFTARPLARGILDSNLLAKFEELPLSRQVEFTKQIGQSREVILGDWMQLNPAW
ncbi:hypothetical protein AURDEDRAFT_81080 [Auricularia subglabra TFB-10046 SS5]|nr:hypothetical protein AURDEDRAFT_81080 [Auricularia subglabra TFB-10046 SS5]